MKNSTIHLNIRFSVIFEFLSDVSRLLEVNWDAAKTFNANIRKHWGVENKPHSSLDVIFDEDIQRKRTKNAA